jgi:hypothetical protein
MHRQLHDALLQQKQLRAQIGKLAELAETGEATAEQQAALQGEYEQKLQTLEKQIASLKTAIEGQIAILDTTLQAYDAQYDTLKAQAAGGTIPPDQFQRQVQKVLQGRQPVQQKLAAFQTMLAAESPEDLAGVVQTEAPDKAFLTRRASGNLANVVLRIVGAAVAILLFLSVFLPFLSSAFEGILAPRISLLRAGTFLVRAGERSGPLLWVVPMLLAVIVGAASAIRQRMPRGGLLLLVGTVAISSIITGLAFVLFHPAPGFSQTTDVIGALARPGPGAICLILSLLGVYVLGAVNMWISKAGKGWFIFTVIFLVAAGSATAGYCLFGVNAKPALVLAEVRRERSYSTLDINVSNGGNLEMVVRGAAPKKAKRNDYVLRVQRQQENGDWKDLKGGFSGGIVRQTSVEPGEAKKIPYRVRAPGQTESASFRAILVDKGNGTVTSNAVVVVGSSPPAPTGSRTQPPPTPRAREDPALRGARAGVRELEGQVRTLSQGALWQRVQEARRTINGLTNTSNRETLHRRVDKVILDGLDRAARPMYDRAVGLANQEEWERALKACNEAISVYEAPGVPRPRVSRLDDSPVLANARVLLAQVSLMSDPTKRYIVTGAMRAGSAVCAFVTDGATGRKSRVVKDDRLDGFDVVEVSESPAGIVLRKGINTWKIEKR